MPNPIIPPANPTILIIEDDPLLVNMYKTKLTMEGFNVLTAEDGQQGLRLAVQQKIDFILLDIMMPKMSGIELLTSLRQSIRGKSIPVIVMSNLIDEDKVKQATALGVKEFLVKSNVTPSQVVEKIRQYIAK